MGMGKCLVFSGNTRNLRSFGEHGNVHKKKSFLSLNRRGMGINSIMYFVRLVIFYIYIYILSWRSRFETSCCKILFALFYVLNPLVFLKFVFDALNV